MRCLFFVKQKTAYEMRISDWSSDVCSSDLQVGDVAQQHHLSLPARQRVERAVQVDALGVEARAQVDLRRRLAAHRRPTTMYVDRDVAADARDPGHRARHPKQLGMGKRVYVRVHRGGSRLI